MAILVLPLWSFSWARKRLFPADLWEYILSLSCCVVWPTYLTLESQSLCWQIKAYTTREERQLNPGNTRSSWPGTGIVLCGYFVMTILSNSNDLVFRFRLKGVIAKMLENCLLSFLEMTSWIFWISLSKMVNH